MGKQIWLNTRAMQITRQEKLKLTKRMEELEQNSRNMQTSEYNSNSMENLTDIQN